MNGSTRSEQGDDIGKYSRFSKHDLYQDFSKQGLIEFPSSQEAVSSNLQFLYLQGNALQKLPNDFFHKFLALRHLDLRHNHLVEIPISVAGHECLEVLLLQDNKLTALPCALGQVPRLRKLQISGNPLEWPPGDTLSKGLESILSFLRCAFMEQLNIENDNAIPKADNFDCTKDTDMRAMVNAPIVKIVGTTSEHSDSFKALDGSERNTQVKQNLSEADKTILLKGKSKKLQYRSSSTSSNSVLKAISPSFKPHISPGNALAIMNGQCFPLGYKKRTCPSTNKVYKMLLKKIWLNELKCILQSQDHALQKQKTSEALEQWRQVAKLHQKSNCSQNWTASKQIFGKKRYSKPTSHSNNSAITYQEQFNQILRSFHELTDVRCRNIEPTDGDSSKQREILAEEMQRIHKLQKAIKALHLST